MKKKNDYRFDEDDVLSSAEEFLDLSKLAAGTGESASSENLFWSTNASYIAFTTSIHGSDVGAIRVYDTKKKEEAKDVITDMKFTSATWDNKEEGFFYTKVSRNKDNNEYTRIFYHKMGNPVENDELVYQNLKESDASFSL
jgi:prolyl oligopeptidase